MNADYHTTPKPGPDVDGLARLREPFPPEAIDTLPRGGTQLEYVGHAQTTARLLNVDPLWSWEPVAFDEQGLPALARRKDDTPFGLWIRLTVCGVTRLGFGELPAAKGADGVKEAIGDAIRNAAMRFGVALDLWAKGDLPGDSDDPAPQKAAPKPAAKPKRPKPAANQQGSKGGPSCADCGGSLAGQAVTKRDGDYVHRDGCPDGGATPDEDDGQAEDTDALNDHQQAAKLAVDELEDDGALTAFVEWRDGQGIPSTFADLTDEQAQAVYQAATDLAPAEPVY